ncbi:glycoside hydrolase family 3 N-terminal domain-containing protein [Arthrobacter oryzae]|uniref:glycoside hydrolase family 3 N-terminal domain-containing protein n=1 Tax=Arthrobacter oryzae TaxID=409290 RepID=UPI0027D7CDBD|nr:glycoside hydrolase family 3 N-terminal domain-containing protein [Arthrobacter oryzae]
MSTHETKPWLNSALAPRDRAGLLLQELNLDEKMAQVSCYFPSDITNTEDFAERFPFGIGEVSCLEVRSALSLDEVTAFQRRIQNDAMEHSGHGIPAIFHMEGLCGAYLPGATSFPSGLGRAAGWNVDAERRVGEIVGKQERAVGITHTLAPVLDISRDPRMGRQGETYGEDPALASALGVAFTQGLQGRDSAGRQTEAVAKHFVGSHHTEGGIHGAHCNVPDRTLMEIYAKPFQAVISGAGLRGVMPSYNSVGGEPVTASVRLLKTVLREHMGFDGLVVSDYGAVGNLHSVQRVAPSPADAGLAALRAGLDVELHVPQGFGPELRAWFAEGRADIALLDRAVQQVLQAKFRMGLFENPFAPDPAERDTSFKLPADTAVANQSARESLVLLTNDGVLPLRPGIRKLAVIGCHATTARFFFGGYTHYSMAEGRLAVNASMAGLTTSSDAQRTITDTVPGTTIEASDSAAFEDLLQQQKPGIRSLLEELVDRMPETEVEWAYGYPIAGPDESGHEEALAVAAEADVILLTLGGKHGTASIASMGEGIDATNINLPACQEKLMIKLTELGKPMIGIHVDGRPVSSDAADKYLSALLEAWSPAEGGAEAIVDVLVGEYSPSGRLPVSIARNAGQVPVYYNHPHGSCWHQGGSIGFPDYVDSPHTPRYVFGHGLSYTTFDYTELSVSKEPVMADSGFDASFAITNTGDRAGTEVVQLYLSDRFASVSRPVLELAGFRRVTLEPGQKTRVDFRVETSQLAFLDAEMQWKVEAGHVDILIGASSADIRLKNSVHIASDALIDGKSRSFYAG